MFNKFDTNCCSALNLLLLPLFARSLRSSYNKNVSAAFYSTENADDTKNAFGFVSLGCRAGYSSKCSSKLCDPLIMTIISELYEFDYQFFCDPTPVSRSIYWPFF